MIFSWFKRRRRKKLLAEPFPEAWLDYIEPNVPAYAHLNDKEQTKMRNDLRILVAEKDWEGCGGLEMTDEIKVTIAAQASLLLLGLKHDYFPSVLSVLVYPDSYRSQGGIGQDGLFHTGTENLGEAWYRGPVILSWEEVRIGGTDYRDGRNVVLHEFAHQLDFADGTINGTPPLETNDMYGRWREVMTAEYEQLVHDAQTGGYTVLDYYGATNAAEFFAVTTECFFERPGEMRRGHPELYALLSDYYHQDPASRFYW
ncbi:MAG: zinc-dependent peptidase [Gemmataceae bacterium]